MFFSNASKRRINRCLANIKSVEAVAAVEAEPVADLLTPASEIVKPSEAVEELVRGLPFPESHNNDRTPDVTFYRRKVTSY